MYFTLALFLALAVVYFAFAIRMRSEAVLALPLFFPLYLWKENIAGIPFTLVEIFVYGAFLASLVNLLLARVTAKKHWLKFSNEKPDWKLILGEKFWPPILLILFGSVIGVLVTKQSILMIDGTTVFFGRKIALGIIKAWIICPLMLFGLYYFLVKKTGDILKMLNYYTVSALVLSLWGLFQVISQSYITPDARASGPFESANYLALYLAPAVLYLAIRAKESVFSVSHPEKYTFWKMPFRREKAPLEHPENFFFILGFIIIFFALLFTKSYAALASVFIAAVFYFGMEYFEYAKKKGKRFPWKTVAVFFTVAAFLLVSVFVIDPSKLSAVFQFGMRNSSSVRVEVYTIAVNLIRENWLTGIGPGQFPAYYQFESVRILGHVPYEWNMLHPHNLYLAFWLNLGLAGIVSLIWLVWLMFMECLKYMRAFAFGAIKEVPKIKIIGFTLMLAILVHGFLDTPFFKNDLALLFWLIAAVIFLPRQKWNQ